MALTGVDTSPESGLWSTQRGVRATPRSEYWDEWDLGKLPLSVFTPEELKNKEKGGKQKRKSKKRRYRLIQVVIISLVPDPEEELSFS